MTDKIESKDGKFVKIRINMGSDIFHYSGKLLEETDSFITLLDIKEGELKLNYSQIIIQPSNHRKVYKEFSYILPMSIDKKPHKEVLNKAVVTKEGKRLGTVKDITFETRTGELIHIVVKDTTPYSNQLNLERSNQGEILIPYNAIIAIGDFVVVSEEDLM